MICILLSISGSIALGEDYFESEPKDFRAYLDYAGCPSGSDWIEPLATETAL